MRLPCVFMQFQWLLPRLSDALPRLLRGTERFGEHWPGRVRRLDRQLGLAAGDGQRDQGRVAGDPDSRRGLWTTALNSAYRSWMLSVGSVPAPDSDAIALVTISLAVDQIFKAAAEPEIPFAQHPSTWNRRLPWTRPGPCSRPAGQSFSKSGVD
jgi:hypothetical protein